MRKVWEIGRRSYMKRPVIYKVITKASMVLALSLLWARYVNISKKHLNVGFAFMVLGLICICLAWFSYLSLDGVSFHYLNEGQSNKKKRRHKTRDIADFVNEKVISFDELERDEQIVCNLLSNLLAGVLFVLVSTVMFLF